MKIGRYGAFLVVFLLVTAGVGAYVSETLAAEGEIVLSVSNAGGLSLRVNDRQTLPLGRSGEVRKNIVITRQNLPALVEREGSAASDGHSG